MTEAKTDRTPIHIITRMAFVVPLRDDVDYGPARAWVPSKDEHSEVYVVYEWSLTRQTFVRSREDFDGRRQARAYAKKRDAALRGLAIEREKLLNPVGTFTVSRPGMEDFTYTRGESSAEAGD